MWTALRVVVEAAWRTEASAAPRLLMGGWELFLAEVEAAGGGLVPRWLLTRVGVAAVLVLVVGGGNVDCDGAAGVSAGANAGLDAVASSRAFIRAFPEP